MTSKSWKTVGSEVYAVIEGDVRLVRIVGLEKDNRRGFFRVQLFGTDTAGPEFVNVPVGNFRPDYRSEDNGRGEAVCLAVATT